MSHHTRARVLGTAARLAQYLPRGGTRISNVLLWSSGPVVQSTYGPLLHSKWGDSTFSFCATGAYGRYLSNFLKSLPYAFSFIDIGANIGLYSLIASSNKFCAKCYALEPNPEVYSYLLANAVLNGAHNIQPYCLAISDRNGHVGFASDGAHSGTSRIGTDGQITVKAVNYEFIDDVAGADQLEKIVKIDVEGHEPIVVSELLRSRAWPQIRNLYCEIDEDQIDGCALIETICDAGFKIAHKTTDGINSDRHYDIMFERR
jgi:FkbM family methyltransferase